MIYPTCSLEGPYILPLWNEVATQNHDWDGLLQPNSIMVVYVDLLGRSSKRGAPQFDTCLVFVPLWSTDLDDTLAEA